MPARHCAARAAAGLALLFVLTAAPLPAQQEMLTLNPPLSQVFPLHQLPDGMRLAFPVLLNDHTILGPEVQLRFIYIDPNAGTHAHSGGGGGGLGGGGGGGGHHHGAGSGGGVLATAPDGDSDSAAPRPSTMASPDDDKGALTAIFGDGSNLKGELRTEVWTKPELFRDALDHASDIGTTIVFSEPGKPAPRTVTIDLPEGMLLGEVNARVTVLGLTGESRAFQGGVRPGDEIRAIEEKGSIATLRDFVRAYTSLQDEARQPGHASYTLDVWRPSESRTIAVSVAAPPSIPSMF